MDPRDTSKYTRIPDQVLLGMPVDDGLGQPEQRLLELLFMSNQMAEGEQRSKDRWTDTETQTDEGTDTDRQSDQ